MAIIDQLLTNMVEIGGSDLHMMVGQPAKTRIHGDLIPVTEENVSESFMEKMLKEICPEDKWKTFMEHRDLDFAYEIPEDSEQTSCMIFMAWARCSGKFQQRFLQ